MNDIKDMVMDILRKYLNLEHQKSLTKTNHPELFLGWVVIEEELLDELSNLIKQREKEAIKGFVENIADYNFHYWRECPYCGYAGNNYLHCMHDGVQSKCVKCDAIFSSFEGDCDCKFVVTIDELETLSQTKGERIRNENK